MDARCDVATCRQKAEYVVRVHRLGASQRDDAVRARCTGHAFVIIRGAA